jgi:phosphonoacetate hydrolase
MYHFVLMAGSRTSTMRPTMPALTRRDFLLAAAAQVVRSTPQRVVIVMCDGFGSEYLAGSNMPTLARWKNAGVYRPVQGVMPSVTNANNASICCGAWPEVHGITGNSYWNARAGREEYMESADLVLMPTLFERASRHGIKSALLSSKKKTTTLLRRGASLVLTPEAPPADWVRRLGPAPDIYSREINYWLLRAAIDLLKTRRDLGCLYVHTTDYPMHTWPPEAPESQEHLARLDAFFAEAADAAPDAAFLVTADHGLHHKSRCWDLEKACANRGLIVRKAISAERDRKHHQGFGGTAWVYLERPSDADRAATLLSRLAGVETVIGRDDAVRTYHLMGDRIGDLVVLGDRDTVFGTLDAESETLPAEYRSHGSVYELDVPLFLFNAIGAPQPDYFHHNLDIARWLYP